VSTTAEQRRGIHKTLIHLGVLIAIILGLFFWKLNREAVVKPAAPPPGLVVLETPRALDQLPGSGRWRLALMDRADCTPNQCHPARGVLERLWGSATKLPRDQVDLLWLSPQPVSDSLFISAPQDADFRGYDAAGWFIEGEWERYSHSVLIVNPQDQLVAWVRPPFNASQIVRSMALAGIL